MWVLIRVEKLNNKDIEESYSCGFGVLWLTATEVPRPPYVRVCCTCKKMELPNPSSSF